MSASKTGNATHDTRVNKAESSRQSTVAAAIVTGGTSVQASAKAADIAFYREALASSLTNGLSPVCFITALQELGTGGS